LSFKVKEKCTPPIDTAYGNQAKLLWELNHNELHLVFHYHKFQSLIPPEIRKTKAHNRINSFSHQSYKGIFLYYI
ncbi:MAG: hypothetical protein ACFFG0_29570, partial [Candidatus Thorarchaeota archaeon]